MKPVHRAARIAAQSLAAVAVVLCVLFALRFQRDIPLEELTARWAPPPSRFLQVDGMRVHYRDEGSGTPIILLHGTSASLHTWDDWATDLKQEQRVVRLDLPGFGLTGPQPTADYRVSAYVSFLHHFVEKIRAKDFVLVGNSLGGGIAWHYALAHPELVRGLVLVDSGGYPVSAASRPIAFRLATWPVIPKLFTFLDPRSLVEDGVKKSYGDPARIRAGVVDRYYELALRPGSRDAFVARMRTPYPDDTARLRELGMPTLILWGALDRVIPVDFAHRFERSIPKARLIVYDDLGHIPMEEDPGRTLRDVKQFIDQLPQPALR